MEESEVTQTPVVERRRVIIEMDMRLGNLPTSGLRMPETQMPSIEELTEAVRRELIRQGSRDPNIFGGRA